MKNDIKTIYANNPKALVRRHLSKYDDGDDEEDDDNDLENTSIHFLIMVKKTNILLLKYFLIQNPKAFTITCSQYYRSELHPLQLAALHSEIVELKQFLLQVDSTITTSSSIARNMYDDEICAKKISYILEYGEMFN